MSNRLNQESIILIKSLDNDSYITFNENISSSYDLVEIINKKTDKKTRLKSGQGDWKITDKDKAIRSIRRHNKNVAIWW